MTSSSMWQKSYCTLILDTEKESKSLEKRDNGKVCPVLQVSYVLWGLIAKDPVHEKTFVMFSLFL